jgi:hypothetical protein
VSEDDPFSDEDYARLGGPTQRDRVRAIWEANLRSRQPQQHEPSIADLQGDRQNPPGDDVEGFDHSCEPGPPWRQEEQGSRRTRAEKSYGVRDFIPPQYRRNCEECGEELPPGAPPQTKMHKRCARRVKKRNWREKKKRQKLIDSAAGGEGLLPAELGAGKATDLDGLNGRG